MVHDKTGILHLAQFMAARGIRHIVFSPGSRNAPLVAVFGNNPAFLTYTIVDERSAAFFALGIAQQNQQPVALACTSGSAVLNYAPAVAEAFYQRLPLVLLTADRPPEWIGQGDGQTIQQQNAFGPHVRKSVNLPVSIRSREDLWYNDRLINEALNAALTPVPGPVHINIPLSEPLYGFSTETGGRAHDFRELIVKTTIGKAQQLELKGVWAESPRKMILVGQMPHNLEVNSILAELASRPDVVVLTETTSNLFAPDFVGAIDRTLAGIKDSEAYCPDLLLSFGGAVVSKQIKAFLRKAAPKVHWNCDAHDAVSDTYQCLSHAIRIEAADLLNLVKLWPVQDSGYGALWKRLNVQMQEKHQLFLKDAPWSDLKLFEILSKNIPSNFDVQLGNSTPVRYAQLFDGRWAARFDANRGTSGIDGSLSTAVGAALASGRPTVLITGDLAFFYDSNGLWNKYLPPNLKIIVVNNQGGGIFRFIEGPDQTPFLEKFFEARHQTSAVKLSSVYGLSCFEADSPETLKAALPAFFAEKEKTALLEVHTPAEQSGKTIRDYFRFLRS